MFIPTVYIAFCIKSFWSRGHISVNQSKCIIYSYKTDTRIPYLLKLLCRRVVKELASLTKSDCISEVARFSKMEVVNEVKSYYLEALDYESCRTLQLPIGQGNYRLCQLLCLLPFTRQAAFKCVTNLFYLHTREAVPVGKLISELLSAQKEFLSSK